MEISQDVVKYLTFNEREQAQKAFRIFDQDGSGSISIREFDQILKSLGQVLSEQQLQNIVQAIDIDGDGFIDFQEFLQLVSGKIIASRSQKSYIEAFKLIDHQSKGIIGKQQLLRANIITNAGLKQAQIDQIIGYISNKGKQLNLNTVLMMLFRKQPNICKQKQII